LIYSGGAQQMDTVPFELNIKSIFPQQGGRVLTCTELLRHIPGKRRIYAAQFDNEKVIVKIHEKRLRAKSQLLDEWSKINRLAQAGLNSPRLYFCGRTEHGQWVIVTEHIANSATALELYHDAESLQKKADVLTPLFSELARLNQAGFFQKDLHLGNFLVSGDKVFCLDTATMKFQPRPVDKAKSLRQLAILSWYVPQETRAELPRLLDKYAEVRGWKLTRDDRKAVEDYMHKHINREIKRQLKKTLRTSGRKIRFERDNIVAVFDTALCENLDVPDFLSGIDNLMETGRVLKRRNTSFLSCVTVKNKDIVIKRYNHKGLWHSIRQSLRTSRARRSWLHGYRLTMLCINTPKPLAYIEKRFGPLLWTSYILTRYIHGPNLADILTDPDISAQKKENLRRQIRELMTTLHKNRITHGDFKPTNFVIARDGVYVTDLDAMKVHLPGPLFRQRCSKDISRLERMFS
jgi:tRNA A-37 threonylcarbamoyl transferase component Bud32